MTIVSALYSHLAGTSAITAIVSDAIYQVVAPEDALGTQAPTIVYAVISQQDAAEAWGATDLWMTAVEITCLSPMKDEGYETLWTLGDAVRTALHGYTGTMGGTGGVEVQKCTMTARADDAIPDAGWLIQVLRFEITHR